MKFCHIRVKLRPFLFCICLCMEPSVRAYLAVLHEPTYQDQWYAYVYSYGRSWDKSYIRASMQRLAGGQPAVVWDTKLTQLPTFFSLEDRQNLQILTLFSLFWIQVHIRIGSHILLYSIYPLSIIQYAWKKRKNQAWGYWGIHIYPFSSQMFLIPLLIYAFIHARQQDIAPAQLSFAADNFEHEYINI